MSACAVEVSDANVPAGHGSVPGTRTLARKDKGTPAATLIRGIAAAPESSEHDLVLAIQARGRSLAGASFRRDT